MTLNPTLASPDSKLAILGTIDRAWAIEGRFAMSALTTLAATPAHANYMRPDGGDRSDPYEIRDGVAIIPICGVMTKRETSMSVFFGGCSTIRTRRMLRVAVADERVKSICLVIDSPGGSVDGTADLADEVNIARARKPVAAYIDAMCCSAAYWVAAQCDEIVAGPNALAVGSIGVFMVAVDSSDAYRAAGLTAHLISSGGVKGQFQRGVPILPEALASEQEFVDFVCERFCEAISSGRGQTIDWAKALATGHDWPAAEAKSRGLIDDVEPFEDFLARWTQDSSTEQIRYGASAVEAGSGDGVIQTPMNLLQKLLGGASGDRSGSEITAATMEEIKAELEEANAVQRRFVDAKVTALVQECFNEGLVNLEQVSRLQIALTVAAQADLAAGHMMGATGEFGPVAKAFIDVLKAGSTLPSELAKAVLPSAESPNMGALEQAYAPKIQGAKL